MPRPSVIRINCTEIIQVDIFDKISGLPVTNGTVTCKLLDKNRNLIDGSLVELTHISDQPGTWRGIFSETVTGSLTKGDRYTLVFDIISPLGRSYAESKIEAIVSDLE
jgi:hypothetical protein